MVSIRRVFSHENYIYPHLTFPPGLDDRGFIDHELWVDVFEHCLEGPLPSRILPDYDGRFLEIALIRGRSRADRKPIIPLLSTPTTALVTAENDRISYVILDWVFENLATSKLNKIVCRSRK